eukprot:TRINITY_DN479_c0_g2_i1.p1 TRINITY_DN479_c0_g2~~TRINITY_DN479_c0_g2_i1.p1  ORF type:complete len:591 (-),score=154.51 TRINITY_DN479_c0_g2_i1:57-1829(-)
MRRASSPPPPQQQQQQQAPPAKRQRASPAAAAAAAPASASAFDTLFSQVTETSNAQKKAKSAEERSNVTDALAQALLSACEGGEGCEVEVRFGMVAGGRFVAGVSKKEHAFMRTILSHCTDFRCLESRDWLYLYSSGVGDDAQNLRLYCKPGTKEVTAANVKHTISTKNVSTKLGYDIRLSVASEKVEEPPAVLPPNHSLMRDRKRSSFSDEKYHYWVVDLTEVRTTNSVGTSVSYEFEVEFTQTAVAKCAGGSTETARQVAQLFFEFLQGFLVNMKLIDPHYFGDIKMERVTVNEDKLARTVGNCFPECCPPSGEIRFPGAMPVNLSRSSFPEIQANDYYVSEKTDGIRYLMLIIKSGAYLVSRKMEFFYLQDSESFVSLYATEGPTLLDGELVRNVDLWPWRPVFMAFDILIDHGVLQVGKTFFERLKIIGGNVVSPYRSALEQKLFSEDQLPFLITGKNFLRKTEIAKIFARIKDTPDGKFYDEGRVENHRHHHTDGVIFAPDIPCTGGTMASFWNQEPLTTKKNVDAPLLATSPCWKSSSLTNSADRPFSNPAMFKWKYTTHWTIDFGIVKNENNGTCVDTRMQTH